MSATTSTATSTTSSESTPSAAAPGAAVSAVAEKVGWGPVPEAGPPWWTRLARGLASAATAAVTGCRAAVERPVTLAEGLELARRGDWTTSEHPMVRQVAVAHFWLVQAPALLVAGVVGWSARTPGRLWTLGPLLVTVASVLNEIPLVGVLVPECVTWSYWTPTWLSVWLSGASAGGAS
ncbi:hypothetical protein [Pseudonocardia sp. ICBG601]|uniref:hypothetical protein n=1 Tax=Pseudonocardia sp. ICBG601 TaxID=2846759 RepID=UPI001CF6CCD2|nr:hypothetical protein [Pseudonocardia sp. ICBG601]